MKYKDTTYSLYQKQVKDKDTAINEYIRRVLNMTTRMFVYSGLPDSIPQLELEKILQTNGNVGVAEVNGELYALYGGLGGTCDAYYNPINYNVANPWLKLEKSYTIDKDLVLIKNTPYGDSLLPTIGKYGVLTIDALITLNLASVLNRITMLISASDDKTETSAKEFLNKILNGDFSVIGENQFFKGVNLQNAQTGANTQITQLVELLQYYRATMLQDIGVNANYNMKRERLNTAELETNVDVLLPFVDAMLDERVKGVERVNKMFGTDISVTLGSSWKLEHENFLSLLNGTESEHVHLPKEDMTETEENDSETETETEENDTETETKDSETEENDTETETETETKEEKENES